MADEYPNCEKLNEHTEMHNNIHEFMEWLDENGYRIESYEKHYVPTITQLFYQFLGIDEKELERERQELLAKLQN